MDDPQGDHWQRGVVWLGPPPDPSTAEWEAMRARIEQQIAAIFAPYSEPGFSATYEGMAESRDDFRRVYARWLYGTR